MERRRLCTYSVDSFVRLTIKTDERFLRTDSTYIMDKIQTVCDENLIKYEVNTKMATPIRILGPYSPYSPYPSIELDLYLSPTLSDESYVMIAQTVVSLIWGIDAGQAAIFGENVKAKPLSYEYKKQRLEDARAVVAAKKVEDAKAKEKVANLMERVLATEMIEPLEDRSW